MTPAQRAAELEARRRREAALVCGRKLAPTLELADWLFLRHGDAGLVVETHIERRIKE